MTWWVAMSSLTTVLEDDPLRGVEGQDNTLYGAWKGVLSGFMNSNRGPKHVPDLPLWTVHF